MGAGKGQMLNILKTSQRFIQGCAVKVHTTTSSDQISGLSACWTKGKAQVPEKTHQRAPDEAAQTTAHKEPLLVPTLLLAESGLSCGPSLVKVPVAAVKPHGQEQLWEERVYVSLRLTSQPSAD